MSYHTMVYKGLCPNGGDGYPQITACIAQQSTVKKSPRSTQIRRTRTMFRTETSNLKNLTNNLQSYVDLKIDNPLMLFYFGLIPQSVDIPYRRSVSCNSRPLSHTVGRYRTKRINIIEYRDVQGDRQDFSTPELFYPRFFLFPQNTPEFFCQPPNVFAKNKVPKNYDFLKPQMTILLCFVFFYNSFSTLKCVSYIFLCLLYTQNPLDDARSSVLCITFYFEGTCVISLIKFADCNSYTKVRRLKTHIEKFGGSCRKVRRLIRS